MMQEQYPSEQTTGYLLDLACARKYPKGTLLEKARSHPRSCGLMGHCVESGYALVEPDGKLLPLDPAATPLVVDALRASSRDSGVMLEATRVMAEGQMKTTAVRLVESA